MKEIKRKIIKTLLVVHRFLSIFYLKKNPTNNQHTIPISLAGGYLFVYLHQLVKNSKNSFIIGINIPTSKVIK